MNNASIRVRKIGIGAASAAALIELAHLIAPRPTADAAGRLRYVLETMTQSVGLTGLLISWGLIAVLFAAVVILAFGRSGQPELITEAKREAEVQAAARRKVEEQLREAQAKLEAQAKTIETLSERAEASAAVDGLTGLPNHRAFHVKLTEECWRASRYEAPLSVVVLDIDHFRDYNDTFGVTAGDDVLKMTSALLKRAARACDCVTRYGGQQFAIILPEATRAQAEAAAERFREIVAGGRWQKRGVVVSAGVATLDVGQSASALAAQAERAVSVAKARGRNCIATDWEQAERMAA
ncbi:MAG: GGDEF domain-containing protein [Capsulimonas sp.]|uniref:GGDEF domain-containing protein n=1 Tax=Capsulimonas sp. TaxID=2494211 RepID=UPI00326414C1